MNAISFNELKFSSFTNQHDLLNKTIKKHYKNKSNTRVLEIGCGTGNSLIKMAENYLDGIFIGVDISHINIQEAQQECKKKTLKSSVTFYEASYTDLTQPPFDIIFAESVLHLMPLTVEQLYKKISTDLKPKGKLILIIPYACVRNKMLIGMRYFLRLFRSEMLNRLILYLAKKLYPTVKEDILKSRLEYMYIIPYHFDSRKLRRFLKTYGLLPIEVLPWPSTSIAKPKHRLIVFEKQA